METIASHQVTAPVAPWLTAAILVTVGVHAYLWSRCVRSPMWSRSVSLALTVGLASLAALLPAGMLGLLYMRSLPRAWSQPLMTAAFTYAGLLFFALLVSVCFEPWRIFDRGAARDRLRAALIALTAAGLALVSIANARRAPKVVTVTVRVASLPPHLHGYRIVHLTDLHVGPTFGRGFVDRVVQMTNEARPDLIVLTGDTVDGTPRQLGEALAPLKGLRARDGVFMVFGNHEYLSGSAAWREAMPGFGARVLRNERVPLRAGLELIGIDDALPEGGADFPAAFSMHAAGAVTLVAVHEPAVVDESQRRGATLQLSGHTHGGQIFPLHLWAWLDQGYLSGLYSIGATQLHVSPGVGAWGPPMRLGADPELSVLVLEPK